MMEDEENGQVEQMIDDIFSSGSSTMSSMTHRESEDNAYFFQENVIPNLCKKVINEETEIKPQDLFKSRMSCLKAWFIRCSSNVKLKCLKSMLKKLKNDSHLEVILYTSNFNLDKLRVYALKKLKNDSHLEVILYTSNFNLDKLRVYAECSPYSLFINDKWLNDHNRSLDKRYLDETIKSDMSWFKHLSDNQQMDVIIELLQKSHEVTSSEKRDECPNPGLVDKTISIGTGLEVAASDTSNWAQQIRERSNKLQEAFANYMTVVHDTPEKGKKNGGKRNDKSAKGGSAVKGDSRKKNKQESHSNASSGSKKKGREKLVIPQGLDTIQLLPIWIVKKIFGYLDPKSLKKVREVNTYWCYVADDVSKEKTCRKYINKVLRKLKSNIDCLEMEDRFKPTQIPHVTGLEKRMLKLSERGAVHPKLRAGVYKTRENTLIEKAAHEFQRKIKLPSPPEGYEGFPRHQRSENTLLKTPSCVLGETGPQPLTSPSACGSACVTLQKTSCDLQKLDERHKGRRKTYCIQFS
ncbi:hypothetical protein QE152_g9110 [Popillia japonica]|uniref:F-box domain-containing protein n=1 Tax=Popillia japonica TaxID=7064 RepID=A0AAW1LZE1_POPJA